jgi:NTP pyrophosphatase (non-canonical NTP hydrolase)
MNKFKNFYDEYTKWFEFKKPTDILISVIKLSEEAGEVAEAVIAFTGVSKSKIKKILSKGQTPKEAIREELGDVIVVCLNIATLCKISHDELFEVAGQKAKTRTLNVDLNKLSEALK